MINRKKNKNNSYLLYALVIILTITVSCSTKKKGITHRFYHNMTAHYNGYFNGNESYKDGIEKIKTDYVDRFDKVLPVFQLPTAQNVQSTFSYFDRTFQKASTVIQKHSIYIKKVEYCNWIDKSYLLIAKSQFYKNDYRSAAETFEFIIKQYGNRPSKFEAILWSILTNIQQNEFDKAEPKVDLLQNKIEKKKISKKVLREAPLVFAEYFLKQEQYGQSIEHLLKAIEMTSFNRKQKTRLYFILAQVYQRTGYADKALELFKKVIKRNPKYEMAFNAKLNLAKCYSADKESGAEIKKLLQKMIKDSKNKDYLDQIYYALYEIAAKENDTIGMTQYLKSSVKWSINNNSQKAKSCLTLGDLYLYKKDYINAESFYDSTLIYLDKEYKDYKLIASKKNFLSRLAKNLKTIQIEDSLQAMSRLSEGERNKIVEKIIQKVIDDETLKQEEELERQRTLQLMNEAKFNAESMGNANSAWYFYNPNAMSMGNTEFAKKWGNRKLEDNWRISNKIVMGDMFNEDGTPIDSADIKKESADKKSDLKDPKTYLANVPTSPEQLLKSNEKIIDAYYNLGILYKEGINEYELSIDAYETLIKRYPENKYLLNTYFQLYRGYLDIDEQERSNYYKDLILKRYPESELAKIIKDPDYANQLEAKRSEVENLYIETYNAYLNNNCDVVKNNYNRAMSEFKKDKLTAKFDFLNAICIYKNKDVKSFEIALNDIITKYPTGEVKDMAQQILEGLKKPKSEDDADNDENKEIKKDKNIKSKPKYIENPDNIHLYAVIVEAKNVKINDIKIMFSNHNTKFFASNNLTVGDLYFDNTHLMISVSNFDNKTRATEYINSIKQNPQIMEKLKIGNAEQFIISDENYTTLYKTKDLDKYINFYKKNYK